MAHSPEFVNICEDARARIQETDVDSVHVMLDSNEKFVLIDVREESEWAAGHLPQAIHLSKGVIERDISNTIPDKSQKIGLYCGGGYRSALAADNLQKMGYTNVISMNGGARAWKEKRFLVE